MAESNFKIPKIDLDALFNIQKANLQALHEAQTIVVEAAQELAKTQYHWAEEAVSGVQSALQTTPGQKPEAVLADVKTVAEKAVAVAQRSVDLSVSAQRRVAELLSDRVTANVEQIKSLTKTS